MATQPLWTSAIQLAPEALSASRARDFVRRHLLGHDLPYLIHDVQLAVSELVTNSALHACTLIDVTIEEDLFCVLLTVRDRSRALPVVQTPGPDELTGRGLRL